MTISTTSPYAGPYAGDGSTLTLAVTFPFRDAPDLLVVVTDGDGNETTLALDTDYTVTQNISDLTGSITLATAVATGSSLIIARNMPYTQTTSVRNQGTFLPHIHEDEFDNLVMMIQQLAGITGGVNGLLGRFMTKSLFGDHWKGQGIRIQDIADPIKDQDAATKHYVDAADAELESEIKALQIGQSSGIIGFKTKDEMEADKSSPKGTLAVVTNDPTYDNNAIYQWDGSQWVEATDRLTYALGSSLGFFVGLGLTPATGSVTRTYLEKGRDAPSVKDFGAAGDGATSDSTSFANMQSYSGCIVIPPGNFLISSDLSISTPCLFSPGAKLTISSGVTVSFSDGHSLQAPLCQIFHGEGSVEGLWTSYPEWFGAVTDGSTDCTSAITKCAASLANGLVSGGTMVLSEGSYLWDGSKTVTVPDYCSIKGSGRKSTNIRMSGSYGYFASMSANTELSGITFVRQTTNATAGDLLTITGECTLEDFATNGCFTSISIGSVSGIFIRNFEINDRVSVGIYISGGNDVFISDFLIVNASSSDLGAIRLVKRAEAIVVSRGDIIGGTFAITTSGTTLGSRPAYCRFDSVYFDSCTSGASIYNMYASRFTNCWFSNRPGNGCIIGESSDVSFSQCDFSNCGQAGLLILNTCKYIKLIGCSFISNSTGSSGTDSGVEIEGGTTDFSIIGCTALNGDDFDSTQKYGILVNSGSSDRYQIVNNLISSNLTAGISDSGTGTNKVVSGNY